VHSEQIAEISKDRALPKGERGCCSCDDEGGNKKEVAKLTEAQTQLSTKLQKIVGKDHVYDGLNESSSTGKFLKGARIGHGKALCIVQPGTLQQAIQCLQAIVDAGCVVVPQGSNTGLTGGSVPRKEETRPSVVLSMKRLDAHFPIDDGKRVVCLAGVGISKLASSISTWFPGRESHSILGSTFLNPTTAAGVAFGSGGTLLRKGPARTDRALYCKVSRNKWGDNVVEVVNTLGIEGLEDSDFQEHSGETPVQKLDIYANDVRQGFRRTMAKSSKTGLQTKASDTDYQEKVCQYTKEVSRHNSDTTGEDCNRSEGKVLILATVHDTFQAPSKKRMFWVSFPDMETTAAFRREVCLDNPADLPVSCEYLDRDSVDIIDRSGRIATYLIRYLGTGDLMGYLWNVKSAIEQLPFSWAALFCDKFLHTFNNWVPEAIPSKFINKGREYDHHCMVAVGEFGDGTLDRFMERMDAFIKKYNDKAIAEGGKMITFVEADSPADVTALNAFRFVAALAFKVSFIVLAFILVTVFRIMTNAQTRLQIIKTYVVGEDLQGISVDYGLPKNYERVPPLDDSAVKPVKRMRYSHFGCNVIHEDIAYALGVDTHKEHMAFKRSVEVEGGKLPAEHGHGTEYRAPQDTQKRWMKMDPLNVMNPGIGGLSYLPKYGQK
jgi:D-lactate dehydrogenase